MHYNPSTPADAEVLRGIAADRVAKAVANIERWQCIRDTRQAEYAQAVEALLRADHHMHGGTSDASTT